jgi:hypothetical protein
MSDEFQEFVPHLTDHIGICQQNLNLIIFEPIE